MSSPSARAFSRVLVHSCPRATAAELERRARALPTPRRQRDQYAPRFAARLAAIDAYSWGVLFQGLAGKCHLKTLVLNRCLSSIKAK